MSRYLISTSDESTWKLDRPLLFLGDWCIDQSRMHVWSNIDFQILRPELSDNELADHFQTINEIYDFTISDLAITLNDFHHCSHSKRYWSILIGPWLRLFCNVIMSRWVYLNNAISHFEIEGAHANSLSAGENCRPRNWAEYQKITTNVNWSQYIYSMLWKLIHSDDQTESGDKKPFLMDYNLPLCKQIDSASQVHPQVHRGIVIADSYLPRRSEISLSFLTRSPRIRVRRVPAPTVPRDSSIRDQLKFPLPALNKLHAVTRELVIDQLPSVYLEGYTNLKDSVRNLGLVKQPKTIFTSNRHSYDDVFNVWAAQATEGGSKYVIGQHGGHYGTSIYKSHSELHEQDVADVYLTWGWGTFTNQVKGPCLKMVGMSERKSFSSGNLLVVCDQMFKHPRSLFYGITENSGYLEFVSDCVLNLSEQLRAQVVVRLNHAHATSGDSQSDWWSINSPEITVDEGITDFRSLRNLAKLVVTTFNGTTFLETLHLNIPTIITWSDSYCKIRSEAKPYFEELERVGIFHGSAKSFSEFINANWHDIDSWWTSIEVQKVRLRFCTNYSKIEKKPLRFLKDVLTSSNLERSR